MYQVYYRKYRPQSFEQLVGQNHIAKTLKNAVIQNKLAHAYLFCGPRGTGKTSLARLFAKSINCTNIVDGVSCNVCENCTLLQKQDHPDIIEIDAASNNGVEEIRTLVERVKYAPLKGKYKIYIIDEVHMMTSGAFNALLKTLEEPPAHVIFILATTESHKILPTIISRCQRYDFYKLSVNDSTLKMEEILQLENVEYELAALNLIANLSDGGLRDALGLLEQVVLYSDGHVDVATVNEVCGMVSDQDKDILLKTLLVKDVNELLKRCNSIQKKSLAINLLFTDLLSILKDALIYKQLGDNTYATHQEEYIVDLANAFTVDQLTQIMDELLVSHMQSTLSSELQLHFELTMMKLHKVISISDSYIEIDLELTKEKSEQPVTTTAQLINQVEEAVVGDLEVTSEKEQIIEPEDLPVEDNFIDDTMTFDPEEIVDVEGSINYEPDLVQENETLSIEVEDGESFTTIEDTYLTDDSQNTIKVMSLDDIQNLVGQEVLQEMNNEKIPAAFMPETDSLSEPEKEIIAPGQMNLLDGSETEVPSVVDFIEEHKASDEDILNVLVQADRESLRVAQQKWEHTYLYMSHQSLSRIATVLCDATPVAACEQAIIVTFASQSQANYVNSEKQSSIIEQFLEEILGVKTLCYAISEDHWVDCKNEYMKLRQVGKLPKAEKIELKTQPAPTAFTNEGLEYIKKHFDHEIIEEEN